MPGLRSNARVDPDGEPHDALRIRLAARAIRAGRVVAHPTEGVWGLACDPLSVHAVMRVLELKARAVEKGLIVIGADVEAFAPELASLPASVRADVIGTWPGPVTWVVPNTRFPRWITGRHETVAIRVPKHAQVERLCRAVGGPIVSTSANPAGRPPALTALAVRRYFGHAVEVLPGELGGRAGPSEIRVALSGLRVRGPRS